MSDLKVENKTKHDQWCSFDKGVRGGIILKTGENKVEEKLWDRVKDNSWVKLLLSRGDIIVNGKKVDIEPDKKIKKKGYEIGEKAKTKNNS